MEIVQRSFAREEWTKITETLPGLSLMQTWEYAEAKAETGPWSPVRAIVVDGSSVVAALQGIERKLPIAGGGLLWINRGPLMATLTVSFEDVLALFARWAEERRWYVRAAPPVRELELPKLRGVGFTQTFTGGWSSSVVDLTLSEEQLRARLDQKWRNCLNKAIRAGVTVHSSDDDVAFNAYVDALNERLKTNPFETSLTSDFLRALQAALPDDRKMRVLVASHDDRTLGRYLIATYGDTAEYLSSVLEESGRQINAGHALLWAAMTEMRERGLRHFDLGGMHSGRTPKGIYHFKQGAGGTPYQLANEIETSRRDWRSALIRWRIGALRKHETSPALT